MQRTGIGTVVVLGVLSASCGEMVREGRSPVQLVINSLEAAPGAEPDELGTTLSSDVETVVQRTVGGDTISVATVFNDVGQVIMSLMLKDQGQPGLLAQPSPINQVTITRYRVRYLRTDGRNTEGVDVPFSFVSAVTFTVPTDGTVEGGFEIVRNSAKREAPLAALRANFRDQISTIAEVTFFGRDQAGNDINVTGSIAINFANFADPE